MDNYRVDSLEDNTKVMVLDRSIYKQIMNDSEMMINIKKLQCILGLCPELKRVEETDELLSIFELKTFDKGEVISTPTAGLGRLSVVL